MAAPLDSPSQHLSSITPETEKMSEPAQKFLVVCRSHGCLALSPTASHEHLGNAEFIPLDFGGELCESYFDPKYVWRMDAWRGVRYKLTKSRPAYCMRDVADYYGEPYAFGRCFITGAMDTDLELSERMEAAWEEINSEEGKEEGDAKKERLADIKATYDASKLRDDSVTVIAAHILPQMVSPFVSREVWGDFRTNQVANFLLLRDELEKTFDWMDWTLLAKPYNQGDEFVEYVFVWVDQKERDENDEEIYDTRRKLTEQQAQLAKNCHGSVIRFSAQSAPSHQALGFHALACLNNAKDDKIRDLVAKKRKLPSFVVPMDVFDASPSAGSQVSTHVSMKKSKTDQLVKHLLGLGTVSEFVRELCQMYPVPQMLWVAMRDGLLEEDLPDLRLSAHQLRLRNFLMSNMARHMALEWAKRKNIEFLKRDESEYGARGEDEVVESRETPLRSATES